MAVNELMPKSGDGTRGEVEGGIGGWRWGGGCFTVRSDAEDLLEAGEVGIATALELGVGERFCGTVEHALGEGHLVCESF